MKDTNILSLVQAYKSLEKSAFSNFLQHYRIEIRDDELDDLYALINLLYETKKETILFEGFYVGYKIPQISKEFDLLRFGNEYIINIELKRTGSKEKILKQLKRNRYYLSYLEKKIHNLSFVSESSDLYILNDNEQLEKVDISYLERLLSNQNLYIPDNIDNLFNPSCYLVSPFNSTQNFINNEYFLTNQQEEIKNEIISSLTMAQKAEFVSITGSAGTGKTLLVYDIAKHLKDNNKKSLIIHCGLLNEGQNTLNENEWEIISIKSYCRYDLSNYNAIFIDEAQRIKPKQLDDIIEKTSSSTGLRLFSYDKKQTLALWEQNYGIEERINQLNPILSYNLSKKIRTNKEIATFIKMLFNKNENINLPNEGNVELNYFHNIKDAKNYRKLLEHNDWEVLCLTPSQYNSEHHRKYKDEHHQTSHEVIGQEFDKVVLIIDENFKYNKSGELIYSSKSYYDPIKMLFQNITRTKKKLSLIIIKNEELLDRCMTIMK